MDGNEKTRTQTYVFTAAFMWSLETKSWVTYEIFDDYKGKGIITYGVLRTSQSPVPLDKTYHGCPQNYLIMFVPKTYEFFATNLWW
jgi:hypothetical protein